MKTDDELNYLVATNLMHWQAKDGFFINSQKETKYAIDGYKPLSNELQFAELQAKMQARDYQWLVIEPKTADQAYHAAFTKYGETFSSQAKTLCRAGTIAALKAYKQPIE